MYQMNVSCMNVSCMNAAERALLDMSESELEAIAEQHGLAQAAVTEVCFIIMLFVNNYTMIAGRKCTGQV